MTFWKCAAGAFALLSVLSACGGGSSIEEATGPSPVFAGTDPITDADLVGKTFPLRYIGTDRSTAELLRGTGTITVVSLTELEITLNGISDTLTEFGPGSYSGTVVDGQLEVYAPELVQLQVDGTDDEYLTFLGFETAPASMPNSGSVAFFGAGTSTIALSDGTALNTYDGDVSLTVDFGTGDVSGDLFVNPWTPVRMELTGGTISGNGFSGGVRVFVGGSTTPAPTSDDDVDAVFFGDGAPIVAGTYQATFVDVDPLSVVGAFAGR